MGDERTYEQVIALRCVSSSDGMTADWVKLDHGFLGKVSQPDHQRSQGRQPRRLRHQLQAACDDRVGIEAWFNYG